ncbi:MAG TPA: transketolase family protein [candidate division Zixibacteria bacterium]|nr:transketolase family protein [candidate division Zixibacteria bacterium]HEQ97992.1 transketolase family protein [candidate division Zixibacteria bacterium]
MVELKKTRVGFGHGLVDAGRKSEKVVVLVGDLRDSTNVNFFAEEFPQRFIEVGIAEQNMANVAAGLSLVGKIPFFTTYGAFATCRCLDMLRVTICYSNLNVKIGGAHGGISVGPDGATHQALEEISILRSLPNMKVIVPCDYYETRKATLASIDIKGPVYIRFGRENVPVVTGEKTPFEFGKGALYRDGGDVAILACGVMLYEALAAADELQRDGIDARIINIHTVKPIDEDIIIKAASECGAIVTAEEHQVYGGFGSAVAEVIVKNSPVPMEFVGIQDSFGRSGQPEELMQTYHLKAVDIIKAAMKVLGRK